MTAHIKSNGQWQRYNNIDNYFFDELGFMVIEIGCYRFGVSGVEEYRIEGIPMEESRKVKCEICEHKFETTEESGSIIDCPHCHQMTEI